MIRWFLLILKEKQFDDNSNKLDFFYNDQKLEYFSFLLKERMIVTENLAMGMDLITKWCTLVLPVTSKDLAV